MVPRVLLIAAATASVLSACGSLRSTAAPTCDGSSRRPLNRSLWDWEGQTRPSVTPSTASLERPLVTNGDAPQEVRGAENGQTRARTPSSRLAATSPIAVPGGGRTCSS